MVKNMLLVAALLSLAAVTVAAQGKSGSLTDVSGVWIMLAEGHQIGLELEQKGTTVEGVMLVMGQRQLLVGTYIDRTLTLKGEKTEGAPAESATSGPITARMLDDGTLEGELTARHGRMKWTGERLPKK
jgi:hypothetical protein